MWKSNLNIDKYHYVRVNPFVVRLFGLLGVSTTLLMAVGYSKFVGLSPLYVIAFGPLVFIFIFNKLSRYIIQIFYPKFDIPKHERFIREYWATHPEPPVDIFLPWAGEDLEMHEEVLKAVANLEYGNYRVYMLDDKGSEEHKALAQKYGFVHLSRPNKGEHKKSGNLEYGYSHSNGQFILILDADFIPSKNSLRDTIPYIASDPKIGILQTPQYLDQHDDVHKRSKIEFGGGNIVEEFYKINLPCRDVFKAAMCVGTSAIYRRDAINLLDGTPKVHASEDLATGLLITQHGYYVKYFPLIVSIGKSPETFQGYFKQHHRWCSGNLVFAHYWPRANMNVVARLIYLANPAYYLSEAFGVFFSFHLLLLLYFHANSLSLSNTLYFLPYIVFSRILVPLGKSKRSKIGTKLAALSNSYTYIYTYLHLIFKGAPVWHPTGVKTSSLHEDFINSINIGIVISTTYLFAFLFVVLSKPYLLGDYNNYVVLGWGLFSSFWHAYFLYTSSKFILKHKLSEVRSLPHKSLLYVKAHFVPVLFGLVFVSLTTEGILELKNPMILTAHPVASFTQTQTSSPDSAFDSDVPSTPVPEIIEDKPIANAAEESLEFKYTVEIGDSPIKLSKKAINEYKTIYSLSLTDKQVNYAATLLAKNNITTRLRPGDTVVFSRQTLAEAINEVY